MSAASGSDDSGDSVSDCNSWETTFFSRITNDIMSDMCIRDVYVDHFGWGGSFSLRFFGNFEEGKR